MLPMPEWGKGLERVDLEIIICVVLIIASFIVLAYP
jgi:hypothetical protein